MPWHNQVAVDFVRNYNHVVAQADLFFDEGGMFGPEGEGFERMNLACPQTVILDGLGRFSQVVNRRKRGGGDDHRG